MTVVPRTLLRPQRSGNAFETTVERLVQTIKLGVVPKGQRLPPERELADALQVGRTTLREALEALRQAGYVETRRGRGGGTFVVYDPEVGRLEDAAALARDMGQQLHDALDFRRVLEPGAVALAATRDLSAEERARLRQALQEVSNATSDSLRRGADRRFHLVIAELAGSESLVAAVADVQLRVGRLLAAIPVLRSNITHSDRQHEEMVEAILAGDGERARRVMEEHCDATSALLRGFLS